MTARYPADYAHRLRKAGATVEETPGWQTRQRPGASNKKGTLEHHFGAEAHTLERERQLAKFAFLTGRKDLPPPLCNVCTGQSGRLYLGAAGRTNHAGKAKSVGTMSAGDGNTMYSGNEWLVSGNENISDPLYQTALIHAAVDRKLFGTSVKTVAGHFETSITGKWDPAENGKSINMDKFRRDVDAKFKEIYVKPVVDKATRHGLHIAQWSTQFSDSAQKKRQDANAVFSLGYDAIGITEAGKSKAGKQTRKIVRAAAQQFGYVVRFGKGDTGVAVKQSSFVGTLREGYIKVVPARSGATPHGERGIQYVEFTHPVLGKIRVAAVHYITKRTPGAEASNRKYAAAIGAWAKEKGAGNRIAFVVGDFNRNDKTVDLVWGQPLTSCWDDRNRWPATAPNSGTIDAILRYDGDARTGKAAAVKVWKDKDLHLHGDHFLVVARYDILVKG